MPERVLFLTGTLAEEPLGKVLEAMEMTVVVVTHEVESALNIADRITILDSGRIIEVDTPKAIRRSQNPRVSRSTFSRSMRRGYTLTIPFGAMVSSSGAVSQAKTMIGTRHFPAWAKTLVARLSEMP